MAVFSQFNGIDDNAAMFACKLQQRKKEKRRIMRMPTPMPWPHPLSESMVDPCSIFHTHPPFCLYLSFSSLCMYVLTHKHILCSLPLFSLLRSLAPSICMSRSRHAHLLSFVFLSKLNIPFFFTFFLLSRLVSPSCPIPSTRPVSLTISFFSYSSSYSCLPVCLHLLLALLLLSPYKIIETNPQ